MNESNKILTSNENLILKVLSNFHHDVMTEIMRLRQMFESVYPQAHLLIPTSEIDSFSMDYQQKTFKLKQSLCGEFLIEEKSLPETANDPSFHTLNQSSHFSNSNPEKPNGIVVNRLNAENHSETAETSLSMFESDEIFNVENIKSLSTKSSFSEVTSTKDKRKTMTHPTPSNSTNLTISCNTAAKNNFKEFIKEETLDTFDISVSACSNHMGNKNDLLFMKGLNLSAASKINPGAVADSTRKIDLHDLVEKLDSNAARKRPFMCEICDKTFSHKFALTRHHKMHTGDYRHKCSYCNRSFIEKSNLVTHLRIHTGEKPFKCACGRSFARISSLQVHATRHTGKKPYQCDNCYKSFSHKSYLKRHSKTHGVSSSTSPLFVNYQVENTLP